VFHVAVDEQEFRMWFLRVTEGIVSTSSVAKHHQSEQSTFDLRLKPCNLRTVNTNRLLCLRTKLLIIGFILLNRTHRAYYGEITQIHIQYYLQSQNSGRTPNIKTVVTEMQINWIT
jgi:hypothetical protein